MEFYSDPSNPPNKQLPSGYIWDWDERNGRWGFVQDKAPTSSPSTPPNGWPSDTNWYNDPANPPSQKLPSGYVWDWNPSTRSWGFTQTSHSGSNNTPAPQPNNPSPAPISSTPTTPSIPTPSPPPPPVPPDPWNRQPTYNINSGIKQATPDIVIFDEETIDPEFLTQAFFEEFSGTELINISRADLINGDEVSYSPIKNLSTIRQYFNPKNIIAITAYQETPTNYGIDLVKRGVNLPYFDENGDLVIEVDYVRQDESIEVEISTSGTINRIES